MNRQDFIKTFLLSGIGLSLLPSTSLFARTQEVYSTSQLTGKGGLALTGTQQTLQTQVWEAYAKMREAALSEGINIQVVSGYRSYQRQLTIYNNKYHRFTKQGLSPEHAIAEILKYSTLPGTSRHHWGTDMDIIDANQPQPANLLLEDNYLGNGCYRRLKQWMNEHAETFGFYEVYNDDIQRKGFNYEPWHFSYKPIAVPMLEEFLRIDSTYFTSNTSLAGSQHLNQAFIENYYKDNILDINPELFPYT